MSARYWIRLRQEVAEALDLRGAERIPAHQGRGDFLLYEVDRMHLQRLTDEARQRANEPRPPLGRVTAEALGEDCDRLRRRLAMKGAHYHLCSVLRAGPIEKVP